MSPRQADEADFKPVFDDIHLAVAKAARDGRIIRFSVLLSELRRDHPAMPVPPPDLLNALVRAAGANRVCVEIDDVT